MAALVLHASRALTPQREILNAAVVVEDAKITAVGPRDEVSPPAQARELKFPGMTLVPGFVDVHIHGAGGHDVMEGDGVALAAVAQTVARYGTTSLVATTVTASVDSTCRSAEAMARYIQAQHGTAPGAATGEIVGVHFEGPFISSIRRGVQPAEWILPPSIEAFRKMLEAASGCARILTLAPELPGALELMDAARAAGLVVGMGHTNATYEQAQAAIRHGASHAVHVFNAMRPFSHRETGVIGAVLTSPEVTAEVIADGVHVDAPAIRLLLAAKSTDRVVLISDGTAATGMPDGKYRLGSIEVTVAGGVCRDAEGHLAGSTLTLDRALRNIVGLGVSLQDAVKMLTWNPARLLGLEKTKGVLAPGADADLVLLDSKLKVAGVMTRGVGLA